jgi:hypothetical protein
MQQKRPNGPRSSNSPAPKSTSGARLPLPWKPFDSVNTESEKRAERLLDQLHRWAMEALELPRAQRDGFIVEVATQYYDDAVRNGLSASQAEEWRKNIDEWLHALIETIEVSGGAAGGHA